MMKIVSRDNKILKHVKKLGSAAYRAKCGEFIAEGERLCNEALFCFAKNLCKTKSSQGDAHALRTEEMTQNRAKISYAILSETYLSENVNFQKKLDDLKVKVYTVPDKLFRDISQTDTPQGILFVIKQQMAEEVAFADISRVLMLDGVSEPGNMGTIIRTANAFGFRTIVLCNNCVDIYNPKVIRASMGGIFRTKFVKTDHPATRLHGREIIELLKSNNFKIVATSLENAVDINTVNFDGKIALVIGNEANGVSKELLNLSDVNVKIPMSDGTESLNAAVAAGIAMYLGRE